ncbi:2-keto-4-pentenoate hydratase [Trinickia sp.]|uniref:2-keto-4-pentenoate hydratase n=1 Tax=Trinickia sp. TaxID=2571163 RepID=UPI003F7DBF0D
MIGPASETAGKERIAQWANRLTQARLGGPGARIGVPPEDSAVLLTDDEAYAVQDAILRAMNLAPGGWKIGSKSLDGPAQCAPLPACDVHRSPATFEHSAFAKPALELEVAFVLSRDFRAHGGPYDARTVLGSIATVHAAIEIVSSRYVSWPKVDKRLQLADLLNHGALIVGEGVRYDEHFPFGAPSMRFMVDDANVVQGIPANPAGDPRRLPVWLVNHCTARGLDVPAGTVLTCGSYTGMHFPAGPVVARGEIAGLPPVQLTLD